ncbi:MAG: hypothetical protein JWN12_59 [Candidatus Saccharibacteria bacterium]|nr:hypothetical protein [Candidatus Saccharibacteria bacterium]
MSQVGGLYNKTMTEQQDDYTWRPNGLPIKAQGIALEPILAFKHFVQPALSDVNWIEDSDDVTDTTMSKREWIGLIVHAIALSDLTGDKLRVAKMLDNDDGGLVRGESEAVYVEQTLATYRDNKKHKSLLEAVDARVQSKSSKGQNYADNMHLIVFCNINGDMQEDELAKIVSKGRFNIVNIFGFNSNDRHYLSFLFDKDKPDAPIHRVAISEAELVKAANQLPESPAKH